MGDTVLERNLCFVDTPGYSRGMSMVEGMGSIMQYIQGQLAKSFSFANSTEGEIVSMMGGDGGAQVDLVLYMISKGMRSTQSGGGWMLTMICQTSRRRIWTSSNVYRQ